MGQRSQEARQQTQRNIRSTLLSQVEKDFLKEHAVYEGASYHKKNPGDFKLNPPSGPRPNKTLCDEAGISRKAQAQALLLQAIDGGLVSEKTEFDFPKHLWVKNGDHVFEAIYGGSKQGYYHGRPVRRSDPFYEEVARRLREGE